MNKFLTSSKLLELDLSFNGASEELLKGIADQVPIIALTKAECWEKDLKEWFQFVRCNHSLFCHELIRSTPAVSMGLQFVDDFTIAALNSAWRSKSEATDVLSFSIFDEQLYIPDSNSIELGDIVVSITTAERQAKEHNHSLLYELRWLVSHGFLHLLGWDHPTSEKLKDMLSCQEQLLCIDGNLRPNGSKKRRDR